MPTIIRCEDTDHASSAPMPEVLENHGQELTTEKIRASLHRFMDSPTRKRLTEMMMNSPAYKRGVHAEKH